jgi:glutamate 5-kinase
MRPDSGELPREISLLIKARHSCVIVSSAPSLRECTSLGWRAARKICPANRLARQLASPNSMHMYAEAFKHHRLVVAQLLTHDDIDSRMRRQNAFNTIERILEAGNIVPIVNENILRRGGGTPFCR